MSTKVKDLPALFVQAYKLQTQNQTEEAIALYTELVGQDETYPDALHFLGLAYAQAKDLERALLYLNRALALTPEDAALLNNLGNLHKNLQHWEKAIAFYLQALSINPEHAQAHNNLATIYALQGHYTEALYAYKNAVHAAPDFTAAHFNLGLLLLQHEEYKAAITQFNNVLSLDPENADAQFYLGLLYLHIEDLTHAEEAFTSAKAQAALQVESLTNLGVIALKREQGQLAVDYFSKALAFDNEHVKARHNLASTFMHYDRFENALMHYDVLQKQDPTNSEYLYNMGIAQMSLGHLEEARILLEKLVRQESAHGPALNNLAAIALKMDERSKAQDYLERAVAANPKDSISQHMLLALKGQSNHAATTPEYATNLFNNYALYYDQHMQGTLHYTLPDHIERVLSDLQLKKAENTLDLGCGTGLLGKVLRPRSLTLTGIDIAAKMLKQAREKGLYDQLVESDILLFLQNQTQAYDLILAADVLPYLGSLDTLFTLVKSYLNPGGYFIFTTEISETQDWTLQTSARFSHHPGYIERLCAQNQLNLVKQEKVPARLQDGQPLQTMLFALQRTG